MRHIPWREQCANQCGRRRAKGEQLCRACIYEREQTRPLPWPMNLSERSGGSERDRNQTAITAPPEPLRELAKCEFCGAPSGAHASLCPGYASFVDVAEEYATDDVEEAL